MIHEEKKLEEIIDILNEVHEQGFYLEIIITAIEKALEEGYRGIPKEQRILNLFREASSEWDLDCGHESY